ncbi:hypothetical protein Ddye_008180 [Dipteronia dyeriana]|uniref:Uncharacterized protein n=1 Tax=Dipteronia dyeriana TaxID=168575 RepID=A0AAD9X9D9_9ROSI|nr:hypothetical protein Ddye_008180 [Dipteronia dyeriana]
MCVSRKVFRWRDKGLVRILEVQLVACHERYLSVPSITGHNRSMLFASIKDREWDQTKGWQSNYFLWQRPISKPDIGHKIAGGWVQIEIGSGETAKVSSLKLQSGA